MPSETLRIATRKSPLALWQAEHVAERLRRAHPGLEVDLVGMQTQGDRILDAPLAKVGGKGLFVKELEQSLTDGGADIAVHSMKDVTIDLPEGLDLPVILEREDPRDAFISAACPRLDGLPQGARVGTSSLRRQSQLRARRPDLRIGDLRGNVGTRLGKLEQGDYDAIILAAAGVKRLDVADRVREYIDPDVLLPAIGQGAIGIECRAGDHRILELIEPLNHEPTRIRVLAERALNRRLFGGCQVPIAGYAEIDGAQLRLRALVGRVDGSETVRGSIAGPLADCEALGESLAEDLLRRGAEAILSELTANGP